ncbi:MAG: hypothetical protein FWC50_09170 [Planctomycetaceae bacterium]|nr:hypothetical protein [Planctomycetaceae bacterium]
MRTERGKHGSGDAEWLIIVERPAGGKVKHDYYTSIVAARKNAQRFHGCRLRRNTKVS